MYLAEGLDQFILSKEACESLGLIERNFPTIGIYGSAEINKWRKTCLDGAFQNVQLTKEGTATTATNMSARIGIRPAEEDNHQPLCCLLIQHMHEATTPTDAGGANANYHRPQREASSCSQAGPRTSALEGRSGSRRTPRHYQTRPH